MFTKPYNVVKAIFSNQFATAVNCMDGRALHAVYWYFVTNYGIKFIDSPTDAGAIKCCDGDTESLEAVRYKVVDVSVGKHNSKLVAVVAHAKCAGNPVADEKQKAQAARYAEIVRGWFADRDDITVLSLWVSPNAAGRWSVEDLTKKELRLLQKADSSFAEAA